MWFLGVRLFAQIRSIFLHIDQYEAKMEAMIEGCCVLLNQKFGIKSEAVREVVWVNACSSISYDESFGKENRTIRMRGEVFFDVEKDPSKPFLVHAEPFTFRVTGTSFNVYAFDEEDEISLALIEGTVTAEKGSYMEKLRPGEVLVYNKTQAKITHKKTVISFIFSHIFCGIKSLTPLIKYSFFISLLYD